jgi:diguanylate cyclase (GGDEF)-like protein
MYAELQDKNKLLNQLAIHDSLTGLYNRAYLKTKFDELIVHAKRLDSAMVMVMIDLNNFKQVNDTYGHEEGDLLLQKFAEVCQQMTRQDFDYIFRLGGDEFLILLTHSDVLMADKICMRINDEFMKHTLIASVAYGIVPILLNKSQELAYYLSEADVKMYEYKALFKSENIIGEKN